MKFLKKRVPEFWHHKERVAGGKGQYYIFRNKWLFLLFVTLGLTLIPLGLSTVFFYENNKKETITDLLSETAILARGGAVDVKIFFDKHLSTLRILRSQFQDDHFKNKALLREVLKEVRKNSINFSALSIIGRNGCIVSCCGKSVDCSNINIESFDDKKDSFIIEVSEGRSSPGFACGLRLNTGKNEKLFLVGFIDDFSLENFLSKLKLKDIVDIFIMDLEGKLITESAFFGSPGKKVFFPKSANKSYSRVLYSQWFENREDFNFYGISRISGTDMNFGILLSNESYKTFMKRIKSHIIVMVCLSALFAFIAVFVLVTWMVDVLYRADKIRQVYLTKAARTSKMASIGQLAAGVAHEINNPLAIINEKAGLLKDFFTYLDEYQEDERLLPVIDSITKAVDRAGTITHRLLGFARETDISVQKINISNTIQEILGFVHKEAEYKSINTLIDINSKIPEIITDNGKLQQILINLVNNAIAAMDENGTLEIRVVDNKENESVEIYVKDNGCGISTSNQKKIFEPFFTTKSEIGGTGLGLSLTYGLIRDLHGTLEFDSTAGVGTVFIITLPYKIDQEG